MSLFKGNEILTTVDSVNRLAKSLATCPEVTRYDDGEHQEAEALADAFAELEKLMREFLRSELPRLAEPDLPPNDVYDVLLDIGEVFRRILYHMIEQQKFYQYLVPDELLPQGEPKGKGL